jgi:hypothetical protein
MKQVIMYIFTKIVCTSTKTNQNTASNKYSVLIGQLWSTCKTPVFETSITIRPDLICDISLIFFWTSVKVIF